ncbi:MAG: hypothetical protein NTW33_02900 [Methanoregula sp.]|nr:hypothetical protein [Methanoregula sp.]
MRGSVRFALIAALLFLVVMIAAASAVSITESPNIVNRGEQITITISDLNDGAVFSLFIDGKFRVVPGSWSSFQTKNFNMPFTLNEGMVSANTHGTTYTEFSVRPSGGSYYGTGNDADANGDFIIPPQPYTVNSGLYSYLKLEGTIQPDTTLLTTQMSLLGKKQGPSSSQITFVVEGMDNGEVWLTALVDNSQVMAPTKVVIGSGIPTPVPTTAVPTTTATTVATTTVQTTVPGTTTAQPTRSATTTTLPTGSETAPATTDTTPSATETVGVPGINPLATVSAPAIPVQAFYSADRKVSLKAQGIEYAALMMVSETTVPDSWLMVSRAYTIAPNSLTFSPHATISFGTPASGNDYAYFVGRRVTNDWVAVPSTAGTGTIDGEVDLAGTYALMAFKPESTIQPTVTGTAQVTTPTPLVTVTAKPKIASIAQASPSPPAAAPTSTPLDIMVVAGALATGIALVFRARR